MTFITNYVRKHLAKEKFMNTGILHALGEHAPCQLLNILNDSIHYDYNEHSYSLNTQY
jgi:hypothetical protein